LLVIVFEARLPVAGPLLPLVPPPPPPIPTPIPPTLTPRLPELFDPLEPLPALRASAPLPCVGVPPLRDGLARLPLPVAQPVEPFAAPAVLSLPLLAPLPLFGTALLSSGQEGAFTPDRANQKQVTLKMIRTVAISARFKPFFPTQ
jgi:hypothetical protein